MRPRLLISVAITFWMLATTAWAQPPVADAVMLIDVPDISGSMVKSVASMTAAEVEQLKRTLRPGDLYARILFGAEARLTVLQHVRVAEDVDNISAVVSEKLVASGKTSISKGLIAARDAVERTAGNRRVVLVLASDGENDPPDGQAKETQRLESAAAWWRLRPETDRIIVGVTRANNRPKLEALASLLEARLVSLDDYKDNALVERAIAEARASVARQAEPPAAPRASVPQTMHAWPWVLAMLPLVAIGWVALKRTQATAPKPASAALSVTDPTSNPVEFCASVTANGQTHQTVFAVTELEHGTATMGTAGNVVVPSLPGAPVTIMVAGDQLMLTEEPGTGVRVDGQLLRDLPQPARVGSECRLTHRGVAVTLQLRRKRGHRVERPPIRVTAPGRRR